MAFSASLGKTLGLSPAALHMAQARLQLPKSTGDSSSFRTLQRLRGGAKASDSDRQPPGKGERGETTARPLGQAAASPASACSAQRKGLTSCQMPHSMASFPAMFLTRV